MARYLVTGGAGFIGSHLVESLLARQHQVVVLDNLSTGAYHNIATFADSITFIQGDICAEKDLARALTGVDIVLHHAALPSVQGSLQDPYASHRVNSEGTLHLLIAARTAGVKRVVYAGSSSIYGDSEISPKTETMLPVPLSPYAASKLAGEYYCQVFTAVYGLETVVLRYFNVFGPRQDANSAYAAVIPKFITAIITNSAPTVFGDGEQSRDFCYVSNVVSANLLAAQAAHVSGKVFNIAGGAGTTLNQLLAYLQQITGTSIATSYAPPRSGDIRHSLADIGRARAELGYSPEISMEQGLKQTIAWFRSRK